MNTTRDHDPEDSRAHPYGGRMPAQALLWLHRGEALGAVGTRFSRWLMFRLTGTAQKKEKENVQAFPPESGRDPE